MYSVVETQCTVHSAAKTQYYSVAALQCDQHSVCHCFPALGTTLWLRAQLYCTVTKPPQLQELLSCVNTNGN